jgi:hypothetical protein
MSGYASRESVLRAVFAQLDHEGSGHVDKHQFDIAIEKLVGAGHEALVGGRCVAALIAAAVVLLT